MRFLTMSKHLCVVVVGVSLTFGSAHAAKQCATSEDVLAIQTKSLQTELMVAALACNFTKRYNAFMSRYQSDLKTNGVVLRRFFKKSYGASGSKKLDHFVTELANVASQKNNRGTVAFCQTADVNFERLLGTQNHKFNVHAKRQPIDKQLGIIPCQ